MNQHNLYRLIPLRRFLGLGTLGLFIASCIARRPDQPMPVQLLPAPQQAADSPLVIVLPGIGDDLLDLQDSGIAAAIQHAWPRADVLLTGATFGYYLHGGVGQRLHSEIILPTRLQRHREIWLTGASMGGMGTLLFERRFPAEASGLVLLAPYMGEPRLIRTIAAAGGPGQWNPGAPPASVNRKNYQTELWRVVHGWARQPETARNVWLAAGTRDRLLPAAKLMAPLLPAGHFLEMPGGHSWKVWTAAATEIFARIAPRSPDQVIRCQ
ncbi:MAG: alpha/beta hydrolase [Gammaproteobacteria bacterium]|nr:alpha/beta hydrolase [Gammaproteobacteria bacterium]